MHIKNIKLNLENNIEDSSVYISDPFIIFEVKNFLDPSLYNCLVNEIYDINNFDYVFEGRGEKEKSSINGSNVDNLKDGVFKQFCISCLSFEFFEWFEKTHLKHFKFLKTKYLYARNPKSFVVRVTNKLIKFFNIPFCFFYTEIQHSSIKQNGFIPPHTDSGKKRLSLVYYLPATNIELSEDMKSSLGTVFWRPKSSAVDPIRRFDCDLLISKERDSFYADYEPFHISKYEPNKFAGFIKSDNSWHTVNKFNFPYDRRAIVINIWQM